MYNDLMQRGFPSCLPDYFMQVVDGSNGAKARGDSWPAFHRSTVHTSPLTYDFDFDNVQDILLATFDGDILFFKDTVSILIHFIHMNMKSWYMSIGVDLG